MNPSMVSCRQIYIYIYIDFIKIRTITLPTRVETPPNFYLLQERLVTPFSQIDPLLLCTPFNNDRLLSTMTIEIIKFKNDCTINYITL